MSNESDDALLVQLDAFKRKFEDERKKRRKMERLVRLNRIDEALSLDDNSQEPTSGLTQLRQSASISDLSDDALVAGLVEETKDLDESERIVLLLEEMVIRFETGGC